jgi:hypothetical protein
MAGNDVWYLNNIGNLSIYLSVLFSLDALNETVIVRDHAQNIGYVSGRTLCYFAPRFVHA